MTENVDKPVGPGGSPIVYQETLRPTWPMWLMVPLGAALGWLTLAPLSTGWGIASGIVVAAVVVFVLLASQSDITVTTTHLQVGRATIERKYVGTVTGFRADDAFEQRGPKLHGLAYLHFNGATREACRRAGWDNVRV